MPKKAFNLSAESNWILRLEANLGKDPVRYLLSNPDDGFVAEQLHCYPRAAKKFMSWHRAGMAYLKTALEQSSGEIAARHKARLIRELNSSFSPLDTSEQQSICVILDLSGGLGMDTLAFAEIAGEVHYVDPNPEVLALARNNHQLHGYKNVVYHCGTAENMLGMLPDADWIYIDPSRRNPNRRVFLLNESEPDVPSLWPELRRKARGIMVKLSPMYDLSALRSELDQLTRISVVSVHGEVKEILAISTSETIVHTEAVCLPDGVRISAGAAKSEAANADGGTENERLQLSTSTVKSEDLKPGQALYRPDAALLKAGVLSEFAQETGLSMISGIHNLLFGQNADPIPGADAYQILDIQPYKPRYLKTLFKGSKVNIHASGFPVRAEALYATLGISMGDQQDLFFIATGVRGKKELKVVITKREREV
jgi:SAM-dependent methyltransferase